jgi:stage V sporulation protein B
MGQTKKQTYLNMALILMVANLTVRGIGGIFRIPIYNLLGNIGYANYQDAYTLYQIFFAISTAGLPVAISTMIAVANTNKNYADEKKIFNLALASFLLIGAIGTTAMMFGAKAYSVNIAKNPGSYYSILILAPTLFFVCITSAFRGYFQGRQNMFPTAISEVIEALGKLFVGIAAAMYAMNKYGSERLDVVAAFAIGGLTVGSVAGVFYLYIKKILTNRREHSEILKASNIKAGKNGDILKEIIKISLPLMFTSSIASLSGAIDTFMMKQRLMAIGWETETAIGKYGEYTGMAVPFFNLPNTLIVAFAVSIIPVISTAFSRKNTQAVKSTIESTFRVSSIIIMPCAFGLVCMSNSILSLFYFDRMDEVISTAPLLSILGVGVIFVSLMTITNHMLVAQKQVMKTVISMACGMAVKIVSSYILIGIPSINRYGTPIGTCLCYLTIMSLNFYFLAKYTKVVPSIKKAFLKPFIAGAIMAVCAVLSQILFDNILHSSRIAVVFALVVAVSVYVLAVIILKTLTKEDVLLLPKGEKLYEFMKRKKFID